MSPAIASPSPSDSFSLFTFNKNPVLPTTISSSISYSFKTFRLPRPHSTRKFSQRVKLIRNRIGSDADSVNGASSKDDRWSLGGMTALVTGGTRGIGRAIVEELVGLGAKVHTCSRNQSEMNECLRNWERLEFEVTGSVCDVSIRAQREELMEDVSSIFNGNLNILVNNVGRNIRKPVAEFTEEEFSFLMKTNFESVFHLSQLAHSLLKASGAGSIVFISSVSGFVSLKSMSIQGATKGAINQLTKYLACEWAKDNIRSNAVAPWYIKTSMVEQVRGCLGEFEKKMFSSAI